MRTGNSAIVFSTNITIEAIGDCGISPGRSNFKYDSGGRLIEQVWFIGDRAVRLDSFSYDQNGNRVNDWMYRFDRGETPSSAASFDVKGKIYSVNWINGLPTTTYRYDSHGNWIEAITYTRSSLDVQPKLASVKRRIIDYY